MGVPAVRSGRGRLVCVTGMHRSGTSLAARAVNLLGVSFGSAESLMPPGTDNPAGYWENRFIKELDDEVLARLGGSWDQPPVLAPGWADRPELDDLLLRGREILERDLLGDSAELIGFKDPRLSILMPFWERIAPIEATIVVVRSPGQVAASLAARNGFDEAESIVLWLRHVLAAVGQTPNPLVVRHDDLLADLPGVLTAVERHLGLHGSDASSHRAAEGHLDPTLVHHADGADPAGPVSPLRALADLVWAGGAVHVDALPQPLVAAITEGWLGAPGNRAALTAARAEAVDLRERLRRRLREVRSDAGQVPST